MKLLYYLYIVLSSLKLKFAFCLKEENEQLIAIAQVFRHAERHAIINIFNSKTNIV